MPKDDDSFSNVFDVASQAGKKKPEAKPEVLRKTIEEYKKTSSLPTDTNEAFAKCQEMSKEINKRIEDAFQNSNLTPQKLKEYLSDPSHFSAKQWKALKNMKEDLTRKLENLKEKALIREEEAPKEEAKSEEKKKLKSSMTRKQRWMPMH